MKSSPGGPGGSNPLGRNSPTAARQQTKLTSPMQRSLKEIGACTMEGVSGSIPDPLSYDAVGSTPRLKDDCRRFENERSRRFKVCRTTRRVSKQIIQRDALVVCQPDTPDFSSILPGTCSEEQMLSQSATPSPAGGGLVWMALPPPAHLSPSPSPYLGSGKTARVTGQRTVAIMRPTLSSITNLVDRR